MFPTVMNLKKATYIRIGVVAFVLLGTVLIGMLATSAAELSFSIYAPSIQASNLVADRGAGATYASHADYDRLFRCQRSPHAASLDATQREYVWSQLGTRWGGVLP